VFTAMAQAVKERMSSIENPIPQMTMSVYTCGATQSAIS
jgi:hypothetical protein